MSYNEMSDNYRGNDRGRYEACVRQQGLIYTADGRPDIAKLGSQVTAGSYVDIDAVIAAACFGPNWNTLDSDAALLSAIQAAWPTVAAALHGDAV